MTVGRSGGPLCSREETLGTRLNGPSHPPTPPTHPPPSPRHGVPADPSNLAKFEAVLFPAFDTVLQQDVQVGGLLVGSQVQDKSPALDWDT